MSITRNARSYLSIRQIRTGGSFSYGNTKGRLFDAYVKPSVIELLEIRPKPSVRFGALQGHTLLLDTGTGFRSYLCVWLPCS